MSEEAEKVRWQSGKGQEYSDLPCWVLERKENSYVRLFKFIGKKSEEA